MTELQRGLGQFLCRPVCHQHNTGRTSLSVDDMIEGGHGGDEEDGAEDQPLLDTTGVSEQPVFASPQ